MTDRKRRRDYLEPFARRLTALVEETGLSQEAVALAVGSTKSTFWFYLNARAEPKTRALIAIADYFGVSIDYLLGRTDTRR